jgi:hypothetical protein
MGNTKTLLLVHKEMENQTVQEPVNLILSPEFYTLKREQIPVRYTYQARRIAPSLFDDLFDMTENIRYFVIKEDNGWLFIAYDIVSIEQFLEEKGISTEYVAKVYFAEQFAELFHAPIKLGEKKALISFNGSVVIVPVSALEQGTQCKTMDNSFVPASIKGISLTGSKNTLINAKETYLLSLIFFLFGLVFIVEGSHYGHHNLEKKIQTLLEHHPSLQSHYTRNSISQKYKIIDKRERRKREIINNLSHMIFRGVTLTHFHIDDKQFQAQFDCKNAQVVQKLQDLAKQQHFNVVRLANRNTLKIGGKL